MYSVLELSTERSAPEHALGVGIVVEVVHRRQQFSGRLDAAADVLGEVGLDITEHIPGRGAEPGIERCPRVLDPPAEHSLLELLLGRRLGQLLDRLGDLADHGSGLLGTLRFELDGAPRGV